MLVGPLDALFGKGSLLSYVINMYHDVSPSPDALSMYSIRHVRSIKEIP